MVSVQFVDAVSGMGTGDGVSGGRGAESNGQKLLAIPASASINKERHRIPPCHPSALFFLAGRENTKLDAPSRLKHGVLGI